VNPTALGLGFIAFGLIFGAVAFHRSREADRQKAVMTEKIRALAILALNRRAREPLYAVEDEEYRRRISEVEKFVNHEIDLLSSVARRAPARGGESGAIADAAAALQRRLLNRDEIAAWAETLRYLSSVIESDVYEMERPPFPDGADERLVRTFTEFDSRWRQRDAQPA
jgi:hypothetical protein